MLYRISDKILKKYPSFFRVVVFAKDINNKKSTITELESLLVTQSDLVREQGLASLLHPRVKRWVDIYEECGIDTSQYMPSIYTLINRLQKGKKLSFISPIVAIMNIISLTYLLPCGGIDANNVQGDLELGISKGDEMFWPIGKREKELIPPGEIIYFDSGNQTVICRSWNSKGGQSTKILDTTKSVILDLDVIGEITPHIFVLDAANHMASLINKYCGGICSIDTLSYDRPNLIVPDL